MIDRAGGGMPGKGFVQASKLVLVLIGGVLILSILFGRSPIYFLSGVGALTAVLLLVFAMPCWAVYESIQADIFDHLLAVIGEFGLRVFQQPSGNDFRKLMAES
jgi:hypothetical protein